MAIEINTAEKMERPHLLVVDDDPVLLGLTGQVIESLGYVVTTAGGCNEAIARIKENPGIFDAVITDYSLPIMNGIELAVMLKKLSLDISVILYSGRIDLIDKEQITAAGIAGLARKPCSMNNLDSIIKRVIYGKAENPL